MVQAWPTVLVPSSESWRLAATSASGGRSPTGFDQVVAVPGGYWRASLTIPCHKPDKIRALRAVVALGRAETWLVAPMECGRAPAKRAALAAAAVLNATTLQIAMTEGGVPQPGDLVSLNNRLHTLVTVGAAGGVNGYVRQVGIRPWLIRPGLRDQAVIFDRPPCLMRLASDDTAALELQLSRFGTVTVDLEEALPA
jgi:hypothetical protein